MEVTAQPAQSTEEAPIFVFCREQGLDITELGAYGTYPHTNDAVMQFENDVFAYVDSWADRTVIDPETAESKRAEYFGTPVSWASFEPVQTVAQTKKTDDNRTYVALKHETTYSVAQKLRKYGITEAEFVEHNGIAYGELVEGKTYHLPVAIPKTEPEITYELFDEPLLMYVNKPGGAQKWAFGNAKTLKDIISGSGIYPQYKEIGDIVAMAYIPIEGETFAYYMDSLALGDYRETGKVKYMIGFAHSDLTAGLAPTPAVDDVSLPIEEQIRQTIATIEPELPPEPPPPVVRRELDEVLDNPTGWKASYIPFRTGPKLFVIDLPDDEEEILVHDLDQKRPDRVLKNLGHYKISGTIWKDGIEYGRPTQAVEVPPEKRNYYAIPMDILVPHNEFYNLNVTREEERAFKKTSPVEQALILPLVLTQLSYDRLKLYSKKIIQKNKEKQL